MKPVLVAAVLLVSVGRAGAQDIDWSRPPPLLPEKPFQPPRATRLRLANGMAVLVVEKHELPLYTLEIVVRGAGSTADPVGKSGLGCDGIDGAQGKSGVRGP